MFNISFIHLLLFFWPFWLQGATQPSGLDSRVSESPLSEPHFDKALLVSSPVFTHTHPFEILDFEDLCLDAKISHR